MRRSQAEQYKELAEYIENTPNMTLYRIAGATGIHPYVAHDMIQHLINGGYVEKTKTNRYNTTDKPRE